jgi:competence protein ComEC
MHTGTDNSGPSVSPVKGAIPHLFTTKIPLFHATWLFACGIAVTQAIWLRPSVVLLALVPVAILCCIAALRVQRVLWIPLAALWCLLGAWCAEMEPRPAPAPAVAALSDGLLRTVEGTVIAVGPVQNEVPDSGDETTRDGPSQRVDVRLSSIEFVNDTEDRQMPVADGTVRLTIRWPATGAINASPFHCGDRIRAVGRLFPPQVYHPPGVWNRADYLLDQGITSTGSTDVESMQPLGNENHRSLACRFAEWQHTASARLLALPAAMQHVPASLRFSEDDAAMLAAMTTGDRTFLTRQLRAGFERTGSFHMLVVSGFHIAIVAGCLFWIARRLRLPRLPATLMTVAGSFAFALFTGFAAPVQRSLWMVTLYLIGRLVYRERSPLNTIGFAALCLLVVSPRSLFDAGLQMTLLAVVSISGIAVPLLAKTVHPYLEATRDLGTVALDVKLVPRIAQFRVILRMICSRLQRATSAWLGWRIFPLLLRFALRCIELVTVSCIVELAMMLPMAMYFHRITVFALPVNLLILPLLTVLLPAALLMLLALIAFPAVAVVPAIAVSVLLHLSVVLVDLFGSIALGDFRIPAPVPWQVLLFCAMLAAAIALARGGPWSRRAAWAALALAAFAAIAPRSIDHPHDAMLVEAIDVGQGDSLLLITPDGKTLLVDGGGLPGGPHRVTQNFDIGEEVVSPALWARGIRHLDAVALSHAHSDHMGGLPSVLRNFHPTEIWVGNNPHVPTYDALLNEANQLHAQVRSLRAQDTLTLGATSVNVLAPFSNYVPGPEPANNDSLVLHIAYGASSVLLEGDAEAPVERAMLSEQGLQSTLLKVGHHGSISSTQPEFLARVAPQCAVISCGLRNRYGHPRSEVLDELQAAGVRTWSTDIDGATCFRLDGNSAAATPCDAGSR